jgi:hypothetical protein
VGDQVGLEHRGLRCLRSLSRPRAGASRGRTRTNALYGEACARVSVFAGRSAILVCSSSHTLATRCFAAHMHPGMAIQQSASLHSYQSYTEEALFDMRNRRHNVVRKGRELEAPLGYAESLARYVNMLRG